MSILIHLKVSDSIMVYGLNPFNQTINQNSLVVGSLSELCIVKYMLNTQSTFKELHT